MTLAGAHLRGGALRDLAIVALAVLALVGVCTVKASGGDQDGSGAASADSWTFVSIPDFLNADVPADDERWTPVLDYVLDTVADEEPDFVLVPGDLVMGWWSNDSSTIAEQGEVYYSAWRERFESRNLTYYPVVGDHEIGDNPWPPEKAAAVPAYRQAMRDNLSIPGGGPDDDSVAYAVNHKNLTLVALDVFDADDEGVDVRVADEQLDWARTQMPERQEGEHLIVTGHVPILAAPRARGSSRIRMSGGAGTPIWEAITSAKADLYLAGELHDISVQEKDGVMQVIHGSAPAQVPEFNYLVTRVFPDRLELELRVLPIELDKSEVVTNDPSRRVGMPDNLPTPVLSDGAKESGFRSVGTMTVKVSAEGVTQYLDRKGYFESRYRKF